MTRENHEDAVPDTVRDEFVRLPGLFRRWEFEQVLVPGTDFHLEEAGSASDGTPLFALYQREPLNPNRNQEK
jgi:hypothetical protein